MCRICKKNIDIAKYVLNSLRRVKSGKQGIQQYVYNYYYYIFVFIHSVCRLAIKTAVGRRWESIVAVPAKDFPRQTDR